MLCISRTAPNNAGLPYRPVLIVGLEYRNINLPPSGSRLSSDYTNY